MNKESFQYAAFNQITPVAYKWMVETARLLNATASRIDMKCPFSELEGCIDYALTEADITVAKIGLGNLPLECYRWISDVMPDSEVILVPRGRPLNMAEMFKEPFTTEAWCVLLLVLILAEVIACVCPSLFKDDPILLLLCGYDRFNLHRAQGNQRLVYMPLIVFFFMMTNAYGPKIISILTDKPSIPDVTTIEQLITSGIKIKAHLEQEPSLVNDSIFGSVLVNNSDHILHLDGIHAYLGRSFREAEVLMHLPTSYDFVLQRTKYKILEQHRGLNVLWYIVGNRSPLRETFYYVQKVCFETGILGHWYHVAYANITSGKRMEHRGEMIANGMRGWLRFDDLIPAWIALKVGLSLSGLLFFGELIVPNVRQTISKTYQLLTNRRKVKIVSMMNEKCVDI